MSKPILTLPCKQNLQTLEKKGLDYYCNSCDKVLTDFRGKTNEEIVQLITHSPNQVCGIMHPSQMDYKRSDLIISRYQSRIGLSLLGILGLLGPVLVSCEETSSKSPEGKIKKEAFETLHFPLILRGKLTDHHSSNPLGNSKIELIQNGAVIRKELTNEQGEFEIKIQEKDLNNETFELAYHSPDHISDTLRDKLNPLGNNSFLLKLYAMPAPTLNKEHSTQILENPPYDYYTLGFARMEVTQPRVQKSSLIIDESSPFSYKRQKLNFQPKNLD